MQRTASLPGTQHGGGRLWYGVLGGIHTVLQMCIDLRHIHMCSVDKVAGSITGYRCCPQAATKYGAGEWIPPPDSATLIILAGP